MGGPVRLRITSNQLKFDAGGWRALVSFGEKVVRGSIFLHNWELVIVGIQPGLRTRCQERLIRPAFDDGGGHAFAASLPSFMIDFLDDRPLPPTCSRTDLPGYLPTTLSSYLPTCLLDYRLAYLPTCQPTRLPAYLPT